MPATRVTSPARQQTRIIIADDHPIVRSGLRNILTAEGDFRVVGEASTSDEALTLATTCDSDVIVLDLSMPGGGGMTVLKALREQGVATPVLILSIAPEDQFAIRALKAGAAGYLTKRSAPDQLVEAIRRVVDGGLYVTAAVGQQLAAEALRPPLRQGRSARLSDRELEVLRLLASGISLTKIGEELGISVKTVSTHRKRLLSKVGVDSNAALIKYAIEHQIIDP